MSVKAADTAAVSEREAEVLDAVGRHLSNAQIANRLHISVRTVESHVSSLLRKFNVPDRRALAELAPAITSRPQVPTGTVVGLPPAPTTFIGRSYEQAGVRAALNDYRLVTLLGPGGVGKTRLASEVAKAVAPRYPLGTVFVDLVSVLDGRVTGKVADLLGVNDGPGLSLDAALHEYLARGRSLLILDNCEHLLDVAAAFVEKLLADCAELTILATSRERLVIPGERTVPIPPMSLVPPVADDTARSEAEMLFLDRAGASDPDFTATPEVLTELCSRLDGIPLAIELAAARSASLGADSLLAELDDHLRLLAGSRSSNERHSSLRAVIDWSHELLDDDERMMFRRVGVFAGAFDLTAAVEISSLGSRGMVADLIGRLTGKSLLSRRKDEGSRWQMLGTIRLYALDRLADSGEETGVREAHLRWAASVADDLEGRLTEGQPWRDAFDMVADDLRAALITATSPNGHDVSHQLARTLGHLTYACRLLQEARGHYQVAAAHASQPGPAAADLRAAADVAMAEGHGTVAFDLLLASADRAAEAGDNGARAAALAYAATIADRFVLYFTEEIPHRRLRGLVDEAARVAPDGDLLTSAYLASAAAWTNPPEKSVPDTDLADGALDAARRTGDPVLISGALDAIVNALDANGQVRNAHKANKERAALLSRLSRHDPRAGTEIIDTFHMVTEIAVTAGELPDALATALDPQNHDIAGWQPHMAACKPILPLVLQGRFADALTRADSMWEAWQRLGRPPARWMGPAAYAAALAYGLRGDDEGRGEWLARLRELTGTGAHRAAGTHLFSFAAFTDARIALHQGRIDAATAAVADLPLDTEPWYGTPHWYSARPYAWAIAAEVAVIAGLPGAAGRLKAAAPAGAENSWAAACLARAAGRLNDDHDALRQSLADWERIDARFERACTLLLLDGRAAEGRSELTALGCQPPLL